MYHHPQPMEDAGRAEGVLLPLPPDAADSTAFDALVQTAALMLAAPVALLTRFDGGQPRVQASWGMMPDLLAGGLAVIEPGFAADEVLAVADLSCDPRFADDPLVAGEPGLRFYAAVPIRLAAGEHGQAPTVGALCIMGPEPRALTATEAGQLRTLALIAEQLVRSDAMTRGALGLAASADAHLRDLRRQQRTFHQAERMAMIGSWRYSIADNSVVWSEGVYRIHELEPGDGLTLDTALDHYPPHARQTVSAALERTIDTGESFQFEVDFVTARGRHLRVRCIGEVELEGGRPVAVTGLIQDITNRYIMEQSLRRSASVDEVTRIGNRAAFNRALETEMDRARRRGSPLTLALVDLDGFKAINDTHGHMAGDDVLRAIGRRLRAPHLRGAFAARLGGDEFALILTDSQCCAQAPALMERLVGELKQPVHLSEGVVPVSGTIGYAEFSPLVGSIREFIRRADSALYEAKRVEPGTARGYAGLLFRPGGTTRAA